ncbi:hypothetical protein OnM2_037095 [Erysiphe neolycopersici]|uniref:Uncharacterized protein n=1 Tax=Erysiphe neolycopersici TaxID=212602 RepID=A0A420HX50_9PEZI|nr:hypothetical protein OnM2_037095 [Erysiphe neolycopersici]
MSFYLRLIKLALLFLFAIAVSADDKYYECGEYALKETSANIEAKEGCKYIKKQNNPKPSCSWWCRQSPVSTNFNPKLQESVLWPLKLNSGWLRKFVGPGFLGLAIERDPVY